MMKTLNIKATKSSPEIVYSPSNNTIAISGDSYPENSFKLYHQVIDFINEYDDPDKALLINISLVYFNSSTSKMLYDIFDMLNHKLEKGFRISVVWFYEENNDFIADESAEFRKEYPQLISLSKQ